MIDTALRIATLVGALLVSAEVLGERRIRAVEAFIARAADVATSGNLLKGLAGGALAVSVVIAGAIFCLAGIALLIAFPLVARSSHELMSLLTEPEVLFSSPTYSQSPIFHMLRDGFQWLDRNIDVVAPWHPSGVISYSVCVAIAGMFNKAMENTKAKAPPLSFVFGLAAAYVVLLVLRGVLLYAVALIFLLIAVALAVLLTLLFFGIAGSAVYAVLILLSGVHWLKRRYELKSEVMLIGICVTVVPILVDIFRH
jgi:hypothetical protein